MVYLSSQFLDNLNYIRVFHFSLFLSLDRQGNEKNLFPVWYLFYSFVSSVDQGHSVLLIARAGGDISTPVGMALSLSSTRYNLTFLGLNTIACAERTFTLTLDTIKLLIVQTE